MGMEMDEAEKELAEMVLAIPACLDGVRERLRLASEMAQAIEAAIESAYLTAVGDMAVPAFGRLERAIAAWEACDE